MSLSLNCFVQSHPLISVNNNQINGVLPMLQSINLKTDVVEQKATPFALQMLRKIQQAMFVWVFELQTPKSEHHCKIKTDRFYWLANRYIGGKL